MEKDKGNVTAIEVERVGAEVSARRDFLQRSGQFVLGACTLACLGGTMRFALPDAAEEAPACFSLGEPADFKTGTWTWLRDKGLFVLRESQGFAVLSSRCTHLGCTVQRSTEGFSCPCHGASYDHQGKVQRGPAREDLPWFEAWLAEGRLWVDLKKTLAPGTFVDEVRTGSGTKPP